MKKSSFVALILGTISGVMFALGMCMALLPEWNSFTASLIVGTLGIVLGLIAILIWRKMENKKPIKLSRKTITTILISVIGALLLGTGLCLCIVWSKFVSGIIIGLLGIILLLCLIPLHLGLK